ncbi:5'-nucleotidase C-terminal domain-containing protein [Aerococcaceae bacterium NML210727]|nr:5'-nucleotidase C-terminal domain-containing protein [Aerococcaceae bacterium NML210727]MCW6655384.1 5'-nucleotidase C-terminal domain-containing protein [Aerococcaceae bacterium NML201296]MCW6663319.1 5'-nucleotidase C-terminal domain-containing protein [Aerococcaceae bacterium NML190073]
MLNRKKLVGNCSIALASMFLLWQAPTALASDEAAVNTTDATTEEVTNTENSAPAAAQPAEEAATNEASAEEPKEPEAVAENAAEEVANKEKDIVIIHTNDIHGRLEENKRNKVIGVAKLDTVVQDERAKDQLTLLLDAGDAFQGLPISNSSKGEDLAHIMNEMGYDAMVVGNHEFDFTLEQAIKYKELLKFPLLSVNTYVDGVRIFQPSTIIDKDKERVGDEVVVIGVTTPETSTKTHPKNVERVEFRDPLTEMNNAIEEIEARAKAEGKTYNKYVILAHMGIDASTPVEWQGSTLAQALANNKALAGKQIVFIDGHSHTVHTAKYGDNVAYTQTGAYLLNIGRTVLKANGAIETAMISYKDTENVVPSPKVKALVDAVKAKFEAENAVVILENSSVELNGDRENVRVRETNLGNAVADALYQYGQTGFANPTNLAVTNGGGLRATIRKDAPLTKGDVIAVLPFGNIISQIEVKGSQIQEMFVKSLSAILQSKDGNPVLDENTGLPLLEPYGAFLQISGAKVYFDPTVDPSERLLRVEILNNSTGAYEALDLMKTYYLATNDFLAAGGDGYTMLGGAREEGPSLDEVFADFLRSQKDLSAYSVVNPNKRIIALLGSADADQDGISNKDELTKGTNPFVAEAKEEPKKEDPKQEAPKKDEPTMKKADTPQTMPETLPETGEPVTIFTFAGIVSMLTGAVASRKRRK